MRPSCFRLALLALAVSALGTFAACGGGEDSDDGQPLPACRDGEDNDGDGMLDFPDDLGCVSDNDETEDSLQSATCMDGRDNDGDGKTDYPNDPGCSAPQVDDEADDCPNGDQCPACANGEDDDTNGVIDYPNDPGCTAAGDDQEYLSNPVACGTSMKVLPLPPTGLAMGMLDATSTSAITSPCGGGGGSPAVAYELHLLTNRVVEISTDDQLTTTDTVIDVRSEMCMDTAAEITCNDDLSPTNDKSKVTVALTAGDYYIIISGHDSSAAGGYAVQVKTFAGEGTGCATEVDCGPGLVCRNAVGASTLSCLKPQCGDSVDDDGDGKTGYPTDPGCTSLTDNDELDTCPGPGCPECGDGVDNDGDAGTDYPNDTTCLAAGDSSESCVTTDGVGLITMPHTIGTTLGLANDVAPSCGTTGTHTAPDRTFRLDLPLTTTLRIANDSTVFSTMSLLNSTCGGTPLVCNSSDLITRTNNPAGTYFLVLDGYSTGSGPYDLAVSGTIANGASCESALAQSGALTCAQGFTCKGTAGARTCQPGLCGDGLDNDADGKIDFPNDPGCTDLGDDTETNPATPPVCSNGTDDDADGLTDYPADFGCSSAAGTAEKFCTAEVDPTTLITTNPTTGTTVGLANNFTSAMLCPSTSPTTNGPDKAYAISIPVFLTSLTMDLGTTATTFDTVLTFRDATCATQIACDDDSGDPGTQSKLTVTSVAPGNYGILIDGYQSAAGSYSLLVKGVAAAGQACTSPLFTGGANAVLSCPTACTAGVCN